ncbi:unnamed protein product, partial [Meganyctiphanes norvegica]
MKKDVWLGLLLLAAALETSNGQFFGKKLSPPKKITLLSPVFDNASKKDVDRCFFQLKGNIDDCSCSVETLDSFNNNKIYPRLNSLLEKDYFRYFKVNLKRECPFWVDDSRCAMRFCSVQACTTIPPGLKGEAEAMSNEDKSAMDDKSHMSDGHCDNDDDNLGKLNTTRSEVSKLNFKRWADHDDAQDNFCYLEDESSGESEYVDLLLNPERYTGYAGPSAWRIWTTIYQENCFKPSTKLGPLGEMGAIDVLKDLCLEKRTFYRAISGLHSSINIHLSARYLLSDSMGDGEWGPNLKEFQKRFDPELTGGEGPLRLKNLYFLYLAELRALAKAAPYLANQLYYTGNKEQDADTVKAVEDLLNVAKTFIFGKGSCAAYKQQQDELEFLKNVMNEHGCMNENSCKLSKALAVNGVDTSFNYYVVCFSWLVVHRVALGHSNLPKLAFHLLEVACAILILDFLSSNNKKDFYYATFKLSGIGR